MNRRRRIKIAAPVVAVLGVIGLGLTAPPASAATTYTWSTFIKCKFMTADATVVSETTVRWRINNTGSSRRIDWVEIRDPSNGGNRIDQATFAELDLMLNRVGAGVTYKPNIAPPNTPYNISLGQLNTTQMPYVSNSTPMQVQFHLHRIESPAHECAVRHSY